MASSEAGCRKEDPHIDWKRPEGERGYNNFEFKAMSDLPMNIRLPAGMTTSLTFGKGEFCSAFLQNAHHALKPIHMGKNVPQSTSKLYRSFEKPKTTAALPATPPHPAGPPHPSLSTLSKTGTMAKLQESKIRVLRIKSHLQQASAGQALTHRPRKQKRSPRINQLELKQIEQLVADNHISAPPTPIKTSSAEFASKARESFRVRVAAREEQFDVIRFLDEGTSGKVYLVQHVDTGFLLCLKVIQKCKLCAGSLNQLTREVAIQSFLNHPNILHLYGCGADAERIYLLLEPCLDGNLYKKLKVRSLPEKDVRRQIKEVSSAIEYMHLRDVIHRDIKPENVLVHENTVKVADFGWAVHSPLLRNTQCGTPLYTPPEMILADYYDSKIDVWCLGVLTYELLYGTIPFQIRYPQDLAKIVEQQVFFSKSVQLTWTAENFIQHCMVKNPHKRFSIRQVLEHDFLTKKPEPTYRNTLM